MSFMIDGKNFFNQPTKAILKHMKILGKLLLVKEMITQLVVCEIILILIKKYKMIAIDLSKQQILETDPRVIQQINFTANRTRGATMFFIIKEGRETVLDFSQGTVKVL